MEEIKKKKCTKCGKEYPIDEFFKNKSRKDGLNAWCKECVCKGVKEYRKKNAEKVLNTARKWRKDNPEKMVKYRKEFYQKDPEKILNYRKKYYLKNKARISKNHKIWYKKNREHSLNKGRQYRETHKERQRELINKWRRKERKINPEYVLRNNISENIRQSLKGKKSGRHWETLVGYNLKELVKHLEGTIPKGYTWDDYLTGELHLDHRIPISIFNIKSAKSKGFRAAWALENLQFLPALKNRKKGNRLFY